MPEEDIIDSPDLITESAHLVQRRFLRIRVPDDFVRSPEGITLLDAITMRLQVIGESVKKIQKSGPSFLLSYSEIEWEKISRFRDLVSHQLRGRHFPFSVLTLRPLRRSETDGRHPPLKPEH